MDNATIGAFSWKSLFHYNITLSTIHIGIEDEVYDLNMHNLCHVFSSEGTWKFNKKGHEIKFDKFHVVSKSMEASVRPTDY